MKKLLITLLFLGVLIPGLARASAAVPDTSAKTTFTSGTSQTLSYTMSAGANGKLVDCVGIVNSTDVITGVEFNGIPLAQLAKDYQAGIGVYEYCYEIINPPSGTHDLIVTISGAAKLISQQAASWTNAKQATSTIIGIQASSTSATWSQSRTATDDNSIGLAYIGDSIGRTPTAGTNTTVLQDSAGEGMHLVTNTTAISPAGLVTLDISSWSGGASPSTDSIMILIEPVAPPPAAGGIDYDSINWFSLFDF